MTARKPAHDADDRVLRSRELQAHVRPLFERRDAVLPRDSYRALLDARALLEAAARDAEAIRGEARQEGLAQAVVQAAALLVRAEREREALLRQAHGEIVTLALAAARKLVGEWLMESPERMGERVGGLLDAVASAREVVILVGPGSAAPVEQARPALVERMQGARLRLEVDPALQPGDCLIVSDVGRIDARLDVQFEALRAALQDDRE